VAFSNAMRVVVLSVLLLVSGACTTAPCESACAGCCDAEGTCHPGDEVSACGVGGKACLRCGSPGVTCVAGACRVPDVDAGQPDAGFLRVAPLSVDFGRVPPGASASLAAVHLTNDSAATATVRLTAPTERAFTVRSPLQVALEPGASADVSLAFEPMRLGTTSGVLVLESSLAPDRIAVTLSGFSGAPRASAPSTLDFGDVQGRPGATVPTEFRVLSLSNVGAPAQPLAALHVLGFEVRAADARSSADELCLGLDAFGTCATALPGYDAARGVAVGATLQVPVYFLPRTSGPHAWDVVFSTDDPDAPLVTVRVTANVLLFPACHLGISALAVDFGTLAPAEALTLPVLLTNEGAAGSADCTISPVTLDEPSGAGVLSLPSPVLTPRVLAPGQSMLFEVAARPREAVVGDEQVVEGAVRFTVSGPFAPTEVALPVHASVRNTPCFALTPVAHDFRTLAPSCGSGPLSVSVTHRCAQSAELKQVVVRGDDGFVVTEPLLPSGVIEPLSAPSTLVARFQPTRAGPAVATLEVVTREDGRDARYVLPLRGEARAGGVTSDQFVAPWRTDVLVVVDDSASMSDKQASFLQNASALLSWGVLHTIDFQVAVTTTDVTPGRLGALHSTGTARVLTASTPGLLQEFWGLANVGLQGGASESCLAPAVAALTAPRVVDPAQSQGLVRDDTALGVVCLTDAGEQGWVARNVPLLRRLRVAPEQLTYSLMGPFLAMPPSGCVYDSAVEPSAQYGPVKVLGGVAEEICSSDWPASLEALGRRAFGQRLAYTLGARPDPTAALSVQVQGATAPAAKWQFDDVTNQVRFLAEAAAPAPGQTLVVTYPTACLP